jgi:2-dehydropantoate 2-reductase
VDRLNILAFGAGAVGTYIGGSLALAGYALTFVERPAALPDLQAHGLRLQLSSTARRSPGLAHSGRLEHVVEPTSFSAFGSLAEAMRHGPFDVCVYALKSFDTAAALQQMKPFVGQLPPIVCFSNGVENESSIVAVLGPGSVLPATLTTAVSRDASGKIVVEKLRGTGLAGGHALSQRVAVALNDASLNCRLYPDAASMKWSKLLTNLIANPASAILDMTPAEIFAHHDLFQLEIRSLRECLAVMRAEGLRVVDLPGTPVRALALATRLPLWLSRPLLARAAGAGRGAKMPSFHIDLYAGRGSSEVEYLHGAVVRRGEQHGVPTPANRLLTETLLALTAGKIPLREFARQPEKLLGRLDAIESGAGRSLLP